MFETGKPPSSGHQLLKGVLVATTVAMTAAPSLIAEFPAGDLHTHVYNAWLSVLVARGDVTGLWLESAWTNSVVSRVIAALIEVLPPGVVERVIQFTLAEGFLWSSFRWCRVLSGRDCWEWLPALAMLSIGWTYQTGLVNWFASAGLSLWAFAIALSSRRTRWMAFPVLVIAAAGNPLPPLWAVTSFALTLANRRSPTFGRQVLVLLVSAVVIAGAATVCAGRGSYPLMQVLTLLVGADQLWVYDEWYAVFSGALLAIWGAAAIQVFRDPAARGGPALLVAAYSAVFMVAVPDVILFPGYNVPAFYLARRGTVLAGVAVTAALARARPTAPRSAALVCAAAGWMALLVIDWSTMTRLQRDMNRAVAHLPPGSRLVSSTGDLFDPALYSACSGRCFVWNNYQPASGAFSLRASEKNSFVIGRFQEYMALETGTYRVPELPFPMWEVAPCAEPAPARNICVRLLAQGDVVRRGCARYVSGPPWRRTVSRCNP